MKYTIPSSIFRLFQLAVQIYNSSEEKPEPKVYKKIL